MVGLISGTFRRSRLAVSLAAVMALVSACSTTESPEVALTPIAPTPSKYAAIVVDVSTGTALHSAYANDIRYPASLTKMMTLYLLFEALEAGKITRDTPVPFSANAARQPPSKIGVKAGNTISVDTAIRALVVKSGNDCATAVAEFLAGSEAEFARIMTTRARSLGMTRTVFTNASGLPDPAQVTTAADMARLSIALRRNFPQYYGYFSQSKFVLEGREINGHNRALRMIPGADGIKTGYTRASGFNLATSARYNGKTLVGVVMGEDSAKVRDARMQQLLTHYLGR